MRQILVNAMPRVKHCAVMKQEVLSHLLSPAPAVYVDCTLGGGGHSRALLEASEASSVVVGIDRDYDCIAAAHNWKQPWRRRLLTRHGNFRDLGEILQDCDHPRVDGILFDLGVSSHQLGTPSRGFSLHQDGPLDMRMDTRQKSTASALINQASSEELRTIFRTLGQERWAGRIAKAIVNVRGNSAITRTRHLADLVAHTIPRAAWPPRIHPATRVFQALRVAVNQELTALADALPQAVAALRSGGRLGVIAFHSLEDRQVKTFFRQQAQGCQCPPRLPQCCCGQRPQLKILTRKPLIPQPEEQASNSRSRSARFRVAEKLHTGN
jgi:16S rRNA (cytosine1402-N4)-methyltransferase